MFIKLFLEVEHFFCLYLFVIIICFIIIIICIIFLFSVLTGLRAEQCSLTADITQMSELSQQYPFFSLNNSDFNSKAFGILLKILF